MKFLKTLDDITIIAKNGKVVLIDREDVRRMLKRARIEAIKCGETHGKKNMDETEEECYWEDSGVIGFIDNILKKAAKK